MTEDRLLSRHASLGETKEGENLVDALSVRMVVELFSHVDQIGDQVGGVESRSESHRKPVCHQVHGLENLPVRALGVMLRIKLSDELTGSDKAERVPDLVEDGYKDGSSGRWEPKQLHLSRGVSFDNSVYLLAHSPQTPPR